MKREELLQAFVVAMILSAVFIAGIVSGLTIANLTKEETECVTEHVSVTEVEEISGVIYVKTNSTYVNTDKWIALVREGVVYSNITVGSKLTFIFDVNLAYPSIVVQGWV